MENFVLDPRKTRDRGRRISDSGFALVISLVLMILLVMLALGLISLSTIELRRASQAHQSAIARANARLALMQAIGQLQKSLGPDQRVSATAEILAGNPKQPQWTGAWRSTREDGSSFFSRDDLAGGLSDARWQQTTTSAGRVIGWLVSGENPDPVTGPTADPMIMSTGDGSSRVEVSKVPMQGQSGRLTGHQAWWTGDLGVRANIRTRDPRSSLQVDRGSPGTEAWFRIMASQQVDSSLMAGGVRFHEDETRRLASAETVSLTNAGESWLRKHSFDFTVDSLGVLADVAHGGLKRDLTAYFAGNGDIAPWKNLSGLTGDDSLVGDPGDPASRHRIAAPRFGLLRDWARSGVPFSGGGVPAKSPETDRSAGGESAVLALANETPVKLAGNLNSSLQPILVEASDFTQISSFMLSGTQPPLYQLRFHHYPRVVLWNPYNVELLSDRMMVMIQGNGRQEMWTDLIYRDKQGGSFVFEGQWLSFEGGRSTSFNAAGKGIFNTAGYNDPYIGAYYFSIPATRMGPGDCLVFSPARNAEYNCLSPYRPGPYNLNENELSCEVAPDPSRSYYISGTDISGGIPYQPTSFWFAPTPYWSLAGRNGVENQSDDTRAVLKHAGHSGTISFEDFDRLPQLAVLSASLQYGAGREPRISWNSLEKMPVELLDQYSPQSTVVPNVRTREGLRLRWFQEHPSNLINSGKLSGTPHFEDALLGNWNPRAAFAVRSPWENVAGSLPVTGSGGGPWFFGAYTRDLYDQAVGWDEQTPVMSGGRYHGNPFGPPQEGSGSYVLFDVPRAGTGVISLAQFQHAKISDLIWHPSYAIGNSLADPRLGSGGDKGLKYSASIATNEASSGVGGFHEDQIGWSSDSQRAAGKDAWALTARAILGDTPEHDDLVYDLSFEVNRTLWDRYYLSTGSAAEKLAFLGDPAGKPLPNSRMRLAPTTSSAIAVDKLRDFHRSASCLMVDGAFNVNSTRVEAWKALLGSSRLSGYGGGGNIPFPRVLDAPRGAWKNGDSTDSDEVWAGYRELTPDEIGKLAAAIVNEVKLRGPFISLADFVNRRLAEDETGRMGALQAAIEKAGLNSGLIADFPLDNRNPLPNYDHPDHLPDATLMEQTLKPSSTAWGAPAWLTQADILQVIGPSLTARSDTFVIRAYGDAVDAAGNVAARAWCEAVVQRTPEALDPDESGLNPRLAGSTGDFGRRFVINSFRWLAPENI